MPQLFCKREFIIFIHENKLLTKHLKLVSSLPMPNSGHLLLLQGHLNLSSGYFFIPVICKITSPSLPVTNDISNQRCIISITHTDVHTYTHKHKDYTPVGIRRRSSWSLFNADPTEYMSSFQCSPLPWGHGANESHNHPHASTHNIYCIFTDILQSFFLSFYLLNISASQSVDQSDSIYCMLCGCVFTCRLRVFFVFLTSPSPANSVSMETGGSREGGRGEMLTSWHLLSCGTPTVSNSVCLCAGVHVYVYFLTCSKYHEP